MTGDNSGFLKGRCGLGRERIPP